MAAIPALRQKKAGGSEELIPANRLGNLIGERRTLAGRGSEEIGETGLEPATSRPPAVRSTKLSYSPVQREHSIGVNPANQTNSNYRPKICGQNR